MEELEREDPFVPIWEGPTPEGEGIARRLQAALIPVERGETLLAGQTRIEVPASYVQEAYAVLDRDPRDDPWLLAPAPQPDEDEDWAPLPGWPPAVRLAIAALALALVALLVLLQVR